MPTYKVILLPTALDSLKGIDQEIGSRILDKLEWLSENFDYIRPAPLKSNLKGFYKLRIGNWRVIYEVDWDKLEIVVHFVGHRSQIYKL